MTLRVAVFGLGDTGGAIARDLALAGVDVHAYDPKPVATPEGVRRHLTPFTAVEDADLICALTDAVDALDAMAQALDVIPSSALYADFSDAERELKVRLGAIASTVGLKFADVALQTSGQGLQTPATASGPGATRFIELFAALGMPVEPTP